MDLKRFTYPFALALHAKETMFSGLFDESYSI